jgi:16S rRNA (uracil1498-N3)-methyltransferase
LNQNFQMQYFYHPNATKEETHLMLDEGESFHAIKVLRHKVGDVIHVLNGKGYLFHCIITEANAKGCIVMVEKYDYSPKPSPEVHIALALIKKKEPIEWFIEKAVEAGAAEISIYSTQHSEKKGFNQDRIHKITLSALKQSGNLWLPESRFIDGFDKMLGVALSKEQQKLIAWCPVEPNKHLKYEYTLGNNVLMLIGPEGDFTENEVRTAMANGFTAVNLGPNRLRAETAAIYSLIALKTLNA